MTLLLRLNLSRSSMYCSLAASRQVSTPFPPAPLQHGAFKYMGEWEAGEQCGEGKCLYADGGKYDGEWRAGLRHGKGSYSHGAYKYNGHWVEDRQDGAGICTNEAGDKYIGEPEEWSVEGYLCLALCQACRWASLRGRGVPWGGILVT